MDEIKKMAIHNNETRRRRRIGQEVKINKILEIDDRIRGVIRGEERRG